MLPTDVFSKVKFVDLGFDHNFKFRLNVDASQHHERSEDEDHSNE